MTIDEQGLPQPPAEPAVVPSVPFREREPVVVSFVLAALPILTAGILGALDQAQLDTPIWIRQTLLAISPLCAALAAIWARSQVTPWRQPRNEYGEPLTPADC